MEKERNIKMRLYKKFLKLVRFFISLIHNYYNDNAYEIETEQISDEAIR